jgi:hypothetical protein
MAKPHDHKFELSQVAIEYLKASIWSMSFADRASILSLSIVEKEHEAYACSRGLIEMISRMSGGCNKDRRVQIAEALRNTADLLEHEPAHAS